MEKRYSKRSISKKINYLRDDVEEMDRTSFNAYKKALEAFIDYDAILFKEVSKANDKVVRNELQVETKSYDCNCIRTTSSQGFKIH